MNELHEHKDFNGVDGGLLNLLEDNGDYLLLMTPEHGGESVSVWITKEELEAFVNKMKVKELEE